MKRFSILAAVVFTTVVLIAACATEQTPGLITDSGAPHYATFADAQQAAKSTGKAIMVDFYTDW